MKNRAAGRNSKSTRIVVKDSKERGVPVVKYTPKQSDIRQLLEEKKTKNRAAGRNSYLKSTRIFRVVKDSKEQGEPVVKYTPKQSEIIRVIMTGGSTIVTDWPSMDMVRSKLDAGVFRYIKGLLDFSTFFQEEKALCASLPFYHKDKVLHIRNGCELIRRWLDQPSTFPATMFLTSLAIIREIFIMAETSKVKMFGLKKLKETFDGESEEVLYQIATCFKDHQRSFGKLTTDCQLVEDKMKYQFLKNEKETNREDQQESEIETQMQKDFFISGCCYVFRPMRNRFFYLSE